MKINPGVIIQTGAALMAIAGLVLVMERGGVLAWTGCIVGLFLSIKSMYRPSAMDAAFVLGSCIMWPLAWFATNYYVISTWESGEVVELIIPIPGGEHTVRTWVLDDDKSALIYYDAEPEVVSALQSGNPVRFSRGGVDRSLVAKVTLVNDLQPERTIRIFDLMNIKYGDRNAATGVYYTLLGRSRDRIAIIVELENESP